MKVTITLNGTDKNPYKRFGLARNPFPAIAKYEAHSANRIIADLGAEPIKDVDDLRRRLAGCTQEFVEGCVARFKPGEMVKFEVEFPDVW